MKLPLSWLREYVDVDLDADELAQRLTFSGLEVEGIEPVDAADNPAGAPDHILELEVTPNRPDCLSVLGVAREVAALYGATLTWPDADYRESGAPVEELVEVAVDDAEGCPRYTARVVADIPAGGASPDWMQYRLTCAGVRPIGLIVDITNYVLLECGQPLHGFDLARLGGRRLRVRRAAEGESMATLDNVDRELTPSMLVIADADVPVALAGIMGGAGSEIGETTASVAFESAWFEPTDVRRTAKELGLSTESSYRFERGVDIDRVDWASRRATALLLELGGGEAATGSIDVYPTPRPVAVLSFRFQKARDLLGMEIDNAEMVRIFKALELRVSTVTDLSCSVHVPAFRVDLEREVDLIEEVARIHGLDHVPTPPPMARIVPDADDWPARAVSVCRANLVGLGLTEVVNYSFVPEHRLDQYHPDDKASRVMLPNPISLDHAGLRRSLVPQLVETLGRNRAHQVQRAALFEIGRVFSKDGEGRLGEEERLAIGLMGAAGATDIGAAAVPTAEASFLWLKGIVQELCRAQKIPALTTGAAADARLSFTPTNRPWAELAVDVHVDGVACGALGLVAKKLRDEWRLNDPVAVAELQLDPLIRHLAEPTAFAPVPAFPPVDRDIALLVGDDVTHEDIVTAIWKKAPKPLQSVRLFDIFTGVGIERGKRSLAYTLTYRSADRTLTDEEANEYNDDVKRKLRKSLEVEIRES